MNRQPVAVAVGVAFVAFLVGWLMFVSTPRWFSQRQKPVAAAAAPAPPAPPGRKIKARLFYVSDDGTRLTGVEREIAYGEGPLEQAREIIAAQIAPVTEPLVTAIPPGTTLRALFMTEGGDAYVDLSRDVTSAHTGGTLDEILTVYTIVNALTANLPAITSVQLLVEGKEVDTLSGHVDLRRPLSKDLSWVQ
jgi:spore germination protein GerM